MRIAVVYSLPSRRQPTSVYGATDEDSSSIAKMVARGLEFKGHTVQLYPIAEDDISKIDEIRADCIFNLIEWCGQDITLAQKAFEYLRKLRIPVTGSNEEMFVLTGDKIRLKNYLQKVGLPTPAGIAMVTGDESVPDDLPYPMIVKPSTEHCSMGLSQDAIAHNKEQLVEIAKKQIATFQQPALAEEFVVGREFLVYLLEEDRNVRVLPIEEITFQSKDPLAFQTYECKWVEGHPDYETSEVKIAKLTPEEQEKVELICTRAFKELGLYGYARLDVRLRDGAPYILEANANPSVYDGETEMEEINQEVIWGIKFPDYLEVIVQAALEHCSRGECV